MEMANKWFFSECWRINNVDGEIKSQIGLNWMSLIISSVSSECNVIAFKTNAINKIVPRKLHQNMNVELQRRWIANFRQQNSNLFPIDNDFYAGILFV